MQEVYFGVLWNYRGGKGREGEERKSTGQKVKIHCDLVQWELQSTTWGVLKLEQPFRVS